MNRYGDAANARALPLEKLLRAKSLTLIRDWTESQDMLPFLLHLTRSFSTICKLQASEILFMTTRSRSQQASDELGIYPILQRGIASARASFTPLDAYGLYNGTDDGVEGLNRMFAHVMGRMEGVRVVIVECVHALRYVFGISGSAFVRSLLAYAGEQGVCVIVSAPMGSGVDGDVESLEEVAQNVIELKDLVTGAAVDVSGSYVLAKLDGRWMEDGNGVYKYKVGVNHFRLFT